MADYISAFSAKPINAQAINKNNLSDDQAIKDKMAVFKKIAGISEGQAQVALKELGIGPQEWGDFMRLKSAFRNQGLDINNFLNEDKIETFRDISYNANNLEFGGGTPAQKQDYNNFAYICKKAGFSADEVLSFDSNFITIKNKIAEQKIDDNVLAQNSIAPEMYTSYLAARKQFSEINGNKPDFFDQFVEYTAVGESLDYTPGKRLFTANENRVKAEIEGYKMLETINALERGWNVPDHLKYLEPLAQAQIDINRDRSFIGVNQLGYSPFQLAFEWANVKNFVNKEVNGQTTGVKQTYDAGCGMGKTEGIAIVTRYLSEAYPDKEILYGTKDINLVGEFINNPSFWGARIQKIGPENIGKWSSPYIKGINVFDNHVLTMLDSERQLGVRSYTEGRFAFLDEPTAGLQSAELVISRGDGRWAKFKEALFHAGEAEQIHTTLDAWMDKGVFNNEVLLKQLGREDNPITKKELNSAQGQELLDEMGRKGVIGYGENGVVKFNDEVEKSIIKTYKEDMLGNSNEAGYFNYKEEDIPKIVQGMAKTLTRENNADYYHFLGENKGKLDYHIASMDGTIQKNTHLGNEEKDPSYEMNNLHAQLLVIKHGGSPEAFGDLLRSSTDHASSYAQAASNLGGFSAFSGTANGFEPSINKLDSTVTQIGPKFDELVRQETEVRSAETYQEKAGLIKDALNNDRQLVIWTTRSANEISLIDKILEGSGLKAKVYVISYDTSRISEISNFNNELSKSENAAMKAEFLNFLQTDRGVKDGNKFIEDNPDWATSLFGAQHPEAAAQFAVNELSKSENADIKMNFLKVLERDYHYNRDEGEDLLTRNPVQAFELFKDKRADIDEVGYLAKVEEFKTARKANPGEQRVLLMQSLIDGSNIAKQIKGDEGARASIFLSGIHSDSDNVQLASRLGLDPLTSKERTPGDASLVVNRLDKYFTNSERENVDFAAKSGNNQALRDVVHEAAQRIQTEANTQNIIRIDQRSTTVGRDFEMSRSIAQYKDSLSWSYNRFSPGMMTLGNVINHINQAGSNEEDKTWARNVLSGLVSVGSGVAVNAQTQAEILTKKGEVFLTQQQAGQVLTKEGEMLFKLAQEIRGLSQSQIGSLNNLGIAKIKQAFTGSQQLTFQKAFELASFLYQNKLINPNQNDFNKYSKFDANKYMKLPKLIAVGEIFGDLRIEIKDLVDVQTKADDVQAKALGVLTKAFNSQKSDFALYNLLKSKIDDTRVDLAVKLSEDLIKMKQTEERLNLQYSGAFKFTEKIIPGLKLAANSLYKIPALKWNQFRLGNSITVGGAKDIAEAVRTTLLLNSNLNDITKEKIEVVNSAVNFLASDNIKKISQSAAMPLAKIAMLANEEIKAVDFFKGYANSRTANRVLNKLSEYQDTLDKIDDLRNRMILGNDKIIGLDSHYNYQKIINGINQLKKAAVPDNDQIQKLTKAAEQLKERAITLVDHTIIKELQNHRFVSGGKFGKDIFVGDYESATKYLKGLQAKVDKYVDLGLDVYKEQKLSVAAIDKFAQGSNLPFEIGLKAFTGFTPQDNLAVENSLAGIVEKVKGLSLSESINFVEGQSNDLLKNSGFKPSDLLKNSGYMGFLFGKLSDKSAAIGEILETKYQEAIKKGRIELIGNILDKDPGIILKSAKLEQNLIKAKEIAPVALGLLFSEQSPAREELGKLYEKKLSELEPLNNRIKELEKTGPVLDRQSFEQLIAEVEKTGKFLNKELIPVVFDTDTAAKDIAEYTETFEKGLPKSIVVPVKLNILPLVQIQQSFNPGRMQYRGDSFTDIAGKLATATNSPRVLLSTDSDIHAYDETLLDRVFGLAPMNGKGAVYSTFIVNAKIEELKNNPMVQKAVSNFVKDFGINADLSKEADLEKNIKFFFSMMESFHELGHSYGLDHTDGQDIMYHVRTVEQAFDRGNKIDSLQAGMIPGLKNSNSPLLATPGTPLSGDKPINLESPKAATTPGQNTFSLMAQNLLDHFNFKPQQPKAASVQQIQNFGEISKVTAAVNDAPGTWSYESKENGLTRTQDLAMRAMNGLTHVFGAYINGEPVGYSLLQFFKDAPKVAFIPYIANVAKVRGQGIDEAMLFETLKYAANQDISEVQMKVNLEHNKDIIGFYQKAANKLGIEMGVHNALDGKTAQIQLSNIKKLASVVVTSAWDEQLMQKLTSAKAEISHTLAAVPEIASSLTSNGYKEAWQMKHMNGPLVEIKGAKVNINPIVFNGVEMNLKGKFNAVVSEFIKGNGNSDMAAIAQKLGGVFANLNGDSEKLPVGSNLKAVYDSWSKSSPSIEQRKVSVQDASKLFAHDGGRIVPSLQGNFQLNTLKNPFSLPAIMLAPKAGDFGFNAPKNTFLHVKNGNVQTIPASTPVSKEQEEKNHQPFLPAQQTDSSNTASPNARSSSDGGSRGVGSVVGGLFTQDGASINSPALNPNYINVIDNNIGKTIRDQFGLGTSIVAHGPPAGTTHHSPYSPNGDRSPRQTSESKHVGAVVVATSSTSSNVINAVNIALNGARFEFGKTAGGRDASIETPAKQNPLLQGVAKFAPEEGGIRVSTPFNNNPLNSGKTPYKNSLFGALVAAFSSTINQNYKPQTLSDSSRGGLAWKVLSAASKFNPTVRSDKEALEWAPTTSGLLTLPIIRASLKLMKNDGGDTWLEQTKESDSRIWSYLWTI
ncbi:MAG: GNAT family N-acetyltransferase, partial [Candidatus Saganbacteria bacterium]|nr:GNAT family N-acetyltransferase [Candidatus Saganbacteria bacterium]